MVSMNKNRRGRNLDNYSRNPPNNNSIETHDEPKSVPLKSKVCGRLVHEAREEAAQFLRVHLGTEDRQ
jgi:hypothetical protein